MYSVERQLKSCNMEKRLHKIFEDFAIQIFHLWQNIEKHHTMIVENLIKLTASAQHSTASSHLRNQENIHHKVQNWRIFLKDVRFYTFELPWHLQLLIMGFFLAVIGLKT
jgi:hypothetical protein